MAREERPQITPLEAGPYKVQGGVEVVNASGEVVHRDGAVSLCRCGGFNNKPFCDGTHWSIGFKAPA